MACMLTCNFFLPGRVALKADYGGRGGTRTPDPLLAKHETRLQQFHWKPLGTNVSNKSGNLLSLKS